MLKEKRSPLAGRAKHTAKANVSAVRLLAFSWHSPLNGILARTQEDFPFLRVQNYAGRLH